MHDNVLASLGRSEVVRFESQRLSEEFAARFPAGTGELEAFETFGPQILALLTDGLGDAQVCRIGDAVYVFVVGGVLSASELDRMLEVGLEFARLLEAADAADQRDGTWAPVTTSTGPPGLVQQFRNFWNR